MTVGNLLKRKGRTLWSVAPEDTVLHALKLMAEKDIGAVLVMEDKEVRGIFTERDYARKIVLKGRASVKTPVRDVMTPDVLYITPEHTMDECMALITAKRIRYLPVMENGSLSGILSIGDIVGEVIDEQEFELEQLENYIKGGR